MRLSTPSKLDLLVISIIISFVGAMLLLSTIVYNEILTSSEPIQESTIITKNDKQICDVNTDDESFSQKLILDCKLAAGSEVLISYIEGLPYARIIEP